MAPVTSSTTHASEHNFLDTLRETARSALDTLHHFHEPHQAQAATPEITTPAAETKVPAADVFAPEGLLGRSALATDLLGAGILGGALHFSVSRQKMNTQPYSFEWDKMPASKNIAKLVNWIESFRTTGAETATAQPVAHADEGAGGAKAVATEAQKTSAAGSDSDQGGGPDWLNDPEAVEAFIEEANNNPDLDAEIQQIIEDTDREFGYN